MSSSAVRKRGPRVFVSYAFANTGIGRLTDALEDRGFRTTVVDSGTLLGAPSLREAIAKLIREADYVVPLLDAKATSSAWVLAEQELAVSLRIPLVPILEPGVLPSGPFTDIPCVLNLDVDGLADRLLRDSVRLDFDLRYPAHFSADAIAAYMSGEKPALVDPLGTYARRIRKVIDGMLKVEHDEYRSQTLRHWDRFEDTLDELQELAPSYRAALKPFLENWSDPGKAAATAWNAWTRLLFAHSLMDIVTTYPPEHQTEWGDLLKGVSQLKVEWDALTNDQADQATLWGVGSREFPVEYWPRHNRSPLATWLRADAICSDGRMLSLLVPDEELINSGMRLQERPSLYLRSWDWMDFVLPQLAAMHRAFPTIDDGPQALMRLKPRWK